MADLISDDKVLLVRIDERTRSLHETLITLSMNIKEDYVTKAEFYGYKKEMKPIKTGVIALVSVIVFTIVITLINSIIAK